jgi:hypothetical protein
MPASPMRFFACEGVGGVARCGDGCWLLGRRAAWPRRLILQPGDNRLSVARNGRRSANPTRDALWHDPSHQAPPLRHSRPRAGHAPSPFYARRSATSSGLRGLADFEWSFPLLEISSAPGVLALRRFDPTNGWRLVSEQPGPRAIRSHPSTPIDFRRGDFTARRNKRTKENES